MGELLIDGVQGVYSRLSAKGVRWLFLSNNAQKLAEDLAKKLSGLGLTVTADRTELRFRTL